MLLLLFLLHLTKSKPSMTELRRGTEAAFLVVCPPGLTLTITSSTTRETESGELSVCLGQC